MAKIKKDCNIKKSIANSRTQDSAAKLIFGNNRLCSQFLRDYSGIELLKNVQEEDIEDMTTRYIPMFTEERDSDVVKRVRLKNIERAADGIIRSGELYLIALLEHKSAVDYNVSMQLLRYMVYIWEDYEKEQEKREKGISRTKDFKYPPILPIVYYEGRADWNANVCFRDRVFLEDVFAEFVPDYSYKLIRLREYSNRELIDNNDEISFVMLIDRLRDSHEFKSLKEELPDGYLDRISEMSADDVLNIIARVVAAMLRRRNVSEEKIAEFTEGIKERPMGVLFEDWDSGPDEELIEKGRAEERKNTEAEKKRAEKAESRAAEAESRAEKAENRADKAESRATEAENHVAEAENRAAEAEAKVRELEALLAESCETR